MVENSKSCVYGDKEKAGIKEGLRCKYRCYVKYAQEEVDDGRMTEEDYDNYVEDLRDWLWDAIDAVEEDRLTDIRKPFY